MAHVIFRALAGSRLYGTDTADSDTDFIEATVPTEVRELYCIGWDWRDSGAQQMGDGNDVRSHDLRRFMHLACRGQTAFLETLFVKPEDMVECSRAFRDEWSEIKANLPTSQMALVGPTLGYAIQERRAAFGETTGKLGAVRRAELDRFGYSPRNAHHGLRVLGQALHCLESGRFSPYPGEHWPWIGVGSRGWLPFLNEVKRGAVDRTIVRFAMDDLIRMLERYHIENGPSAKKSWLSDAKGSDRVEAVNAAVGRIIARVA